MRQTRAQQIADRKADWRREVTNQLDKLLDELLEAPNCADEPPGSIPKKKGVYLFSERGTNKYVGRAGRSFRAR